MVITGVSLVRKDQNCDRAEQQKLLDQMAILDTCKAKDLVYGSFHPLQNPPHVQCQLSSKPHR